MDSNNRELFGYLISKKVLVDIQSHRLIALNNEKNTDERKIVSLRSTMMRLLLYMLSATPGQIISNDEIMLYVWDYFKLSSSNQRLWQVMQTLEQKLIQVGIEEEIIIKMKPNGYFVNSHLVTPLYYSQKSL